MRLTDENKAIRRIGYLEGQRDAIVAQFNQQINELIQAIMAEEKKENERASEGGGDPAGEPSASGV